MDIYKVYWIRHKDHTDILTEGYVGITKRDPITRLKEHKRSSNLHLRYAIQKYENELIVDTVYTNPKDCCLLKEFELRPHNNIGWNLVPGGGHPPIQQTSRRKGRKFGKQKNPHGPMSEANKTLRRKTPWNKGIKQGPHKNPRKPYSEEARKTLGRRKRTS